MIILSAVTSTLFFTSLLAFQAAAAPKVIVDNDRVNVQEVVWDAQNAAAKHTLDTLTVALTGQAGHVAFEPKGTAHGGEMGGKSIVIQVKDHVVPPLVNKSGLPNAFPGAGLEEAIRECADCGLGLQLDSGEPSPMRAP